MRKRKILKQMSAILAAATLVFSIAGCGGSGQDSAPAGGDAAVTPNEGAAAGADTEAGGGEEAASDKGSGWISDEKLTFNLLYSDMAQAPYNDEWIVVQEMEKATNVKLVANTVPDSDYVDKIKLVLTSGDQSIDFISKADQIDQQLILNGALLPVSDYLDQLPYLKAAIENGGVEEELNNITQLDGKFYYVPGVRETLPAYSGLAVRTDLLEKYGMEKPKTVDELYEYLKKYKEENPDSVPLTGSAGIDCFLHFFAPVYGVYAGWSADNGLFYDWYADEFALTYTHPRYKEMLKYLAKLYEEGLFDPEIFTQSDDQWMNKMVTGKSIATYMWNGGDRKMNNMGPESTPDYHVEMSSPLSALEGIKGTTEPYPQLKHGWAMPADAVNQPYFEEKLKYMDWYLNSPEAVVIGNWGVEGVTFEYDENGQKRWLTDEIRMAPQAGYGFCINSLQSATPDDYELAESEPCMTEITAYNTENDLFGKVQPKAKLTVEEIEEASLAAGPLKDYCERMQQQFIFGELSVDDEWDAFVQETERMGANDLVELYNSTLGR